jgi:hypothetical protein
MNLDAFVCDCVVWSLAATGGRIYTGVGIRKDCARGERKEKEKGGNLMRAKSCEISKGILGSPVE